MSIEVANTILVVAVFLVILFCQVMCLRSKTKHNYKDSLFWDIDSMLLAVNQSWIIMNVAWYTAVMKGLLIGINVLGFICVVISVLTTLEYQLSEVSNNEQDKTAGNVKGEE